MAEDKNIKWEDFSKDMKKHRKDYWTKLFDSQKKSELTYRDEDGKVITEKLKVDKSDLERIAEMISDTEMLHSFYDSKTQEIMEKTPGKLEAKTQEALHKYLKGVASDLRHEALGNMDNVQDFYGTLIQVSAAMKIPEDEFKQLWRKAQQDDDDGKNARKTLVSLISNYARSTKVQSSHAYHTRDIENSSPDKVKKYNHAAALAAHIISHGQYSPNLKQLINHEHGTSLVTQVAMEYLRTDKLPHRTDPSSATYHQTIKDGKPTKLYKAPKN